MNAGTYVVILNWNGWEDTLRCVETVLDSEFVRPRIVICDNGSTDGSVQEILAWARGDRSAPALEGSPIGHRVPQRRVPRVVQVLEREDVERGCAPPHRSEIVLIRNGENLGFAGGCNVGLRYAMAQADMKHAWLLNNDTLVDPACLHRMLRRIREAGPRAVCGSMILTAEHPDRINAIGGNRMNRYTGIASPGVGRGEKADTCDIAEAERSIDYLSGASMLVPRAFLEEVGLMDERYFLYYEEADWMLRAGDGWRKAVAGDAVLHHHEGASIGSGSLRRRPSPRAEAIQLRSRLLFLRRHWPRRLPVGYAAAWLQVLNRLRRLEFANARALGQVLLGRVRKHPLEWPA